MGSDSDDVWDFFQPPNEVTWARGRQVDRTYVHRTGTVTWASSRDFGRPRRFIVKVFDEEADLTPLEGDDVTVSVIRTSPAGRKQVTLEVAGEPGAVREIKIQEVPADQNAEKLRHILTLDREASERLILLIKALDHIPLNGGEDTVRLDDETLRLLFTDARAVDRLYALKPDAYRAAIAEDVTATDVMAVAHRRAVVAHFRRLMEDDDYFSSELEGCRGPEAVWQQLFEAEPWLLGVGLGGQLYTSWDAEKLEQVVAGSYVGGPGKRTDALMRTEGRVRAMVFAEIKHHKTDLLVSTPTPYRSGCWAPDKELSGGVVQAQQTVHLAVSQIGETIPDLDSDGALSGSSTYLVRPRSYLVIGNLSELCGASGAVIEDKWRSFELYRRNLHEPEVVTFDELLARAEWLVSNGEDRE